MPNSTPSFTEEAARILNELVPTTTIPGDIQASDFMTILIDHRKQDALTALTELHEREMVLCETDLAWYLGKLQGLGHPNEEMEKQYGFELSPPDEEKV